MGREISISVGETRVTGRVYAPGGSDRGVTLVLGHGAGAGQRHPFMVRHAEGLAARGLEVVTFDFFYTEAGRRVPDRAPVLERCYLAAIEAARASGPGRGLVIGGKSMGGRIASQVAAGGLGGLLGLVFLGYPLHPPGRPEVLRSAHLPRVGAPMLFVQGERDAFGTPAELAPILAGLPGAELFEIPGADHSLEIPKRGKLSQAAVDAQIQDKIASWIFEKS